MASSGDWITVNGRHIQIGKGESRSDAIKRSFGSKDSDSKGKSGGGKNPATTAKGLNDIKKNGSIYGDKAKETQNKCKKVLNDAKEGTTIYAVKESKSSTTTSYGISHSSKGEVDSYRKMENNTWSKIQSYNGQPSNKRLTADDMTLKVLHNNYKWYGSEKAANINAGKIEKKTERSSFYDTYNPKYK